MVKKFVAGSLAICLLAMVFFIAGTGDTFAVEGGGSTTIHKRVRTYEIAVVFDNSGSMYNDASWCRAKYAMEIFASMLNYDNGDVLKIFPMWEVTTDGGNPKNGGSYAPITVKDISDIDKISGMFTPEPGNTPLIPIEEAKKELASSNAEEKWLIVLTDGAFNLSVEKGRSRKSGDAGEVDIDDLQYMLEEIVGIRQDGSFQSTGIKVQYLGIGNAKKIDEKKECNLNAKLSTAKSLKDDLIKICNDIFKRSELPAKYIDGDKITFNLSMRSVIVFAQGADATITGLKPVDEAEKTGDGIEISMDSGQRKYSDLSAWWNGTDKHQKDESLAGQVVTFGALKEGTYVLECTGAEKVQVFYEPDVKIELSLIKGKDDAGNPIKADMTSGELDSGEYTVEYTIIDAVTGKDAVKSGLMGNSIDFTESYIENSKGKQEFKSGDKVTLEPDEETEIVVTGSYLEDYTISTKDDPFAFPKLKIILPDIALFNVELSTEQSNNWFVKSKQSGWEPLIAEITLNGAPLTDAEMERVVFEPEISGNMEYSLRAVPGKSAYEIYLCRTEDGKDTEPKAGSYTAKVRAVYTDEQNRELTDEDKLGFNIELYGLLWRWLFWIILLAAIALLIWFILSRKAWPKNMRFESTNSSKKAKISVNKTMNIVSNAYPGILACSAEKNSTLYHRSKRTASVKITKVTPSFRVSSFRIGGSPIYTKENGVYRDSNGKEFSPIVVRNNTKVIVEIRGGMPIEGIVYINSKKK